MLVLRQSMGPLTGGTGEKADYMLAELLECSERFSKGRRKKKKKKKKTKKRRAVYFVLKEEEEDEGRKKRQNNNKPREVLKNYEFCDAPLLNEEKFLLPPVRYLEISPK
ncbi:hypothetical protein RUM44_000919 [Polyplax serrata]|uniref:Uncharacterized protein n=1 Tax=Polyplax serrata TaxID=468196 RepID=A0ABR1B6E2_POLSC